MSSFVELVMAVKENSAPAAWVSWIGTAISLIGAAATYFVFYLAKKDKKPIILVEPELGQLANPTFEKIKFSIVNNGQRSCEADFIFKPYLCYKDGEKNAFFIGCKDSRTKEVENIKLDPSEKLFVFTITIASEEMTPNAFLEINVSYKDDWWRNRYYNKTLFYQIKDNNIICSPNAKNLVPDSMRDWE